MDGKSEIDLLANLLRQRFHDNIFALEQIKTTVENAYSNQQVYSSPIYPECCKINPTETDYRFKTKVFRDRFCELRAKYVSKGAKHLSKSLKETMINNLNKNPDLRWQYFGSQEGILSVYPAFKFPSCDSYDNRVRPWYVEGIAPEPKDIVLIIDKSGSMEDIIGNKTLIEIAVSSAVSVLNSLNSNDRVSYVTQTRCLHDGSLGSRDDYNYINYYSHYLLVLINCKCNHFKNHILVYLYIPSYVLYQ